MITWPIFNQYSISIPPENIGQPFTVFEETLATYGGFHSIYGFYDFQKTGNK